MCWCARRSLARYTPRLHAGVYDGLQCCSGDLLALQVESARGMVADSFLRLRLQDDGHGNEIEVCVVMGFACELVAAFTAHSSVWRPAAELTLAPLRAVAARCTWKPHGQDDLLVLSCG